MDQFSYLSVLLSIILGLAITQVLQGFRGIMLARSRVNIYWPVLVWSALLLVVAVQSWWSSFDLREITNWTFEAFAIVLAQNLVLYLLTAIVLPDFHGEAVDLRRHYYAHISWFFGLFVLLLLIGLGKDLVLTGHLTGNVNLGFHLCFIATSLIAIWTRREWYHQGLPVFSLLVMCVYISVLFTHLCKLEICR